MSEMAHFFMSVGGSKFHERLAHFFIDIYRFWGDLWGIMPFWTMDSGKKLMA